MTMVAMVMPERNGLRRKLSEAKRASIPSNPGSACFRPPKPTHDEADDCRAKGGQAEEEDQHADDADTESFDRTIDRRRDRQKHREIAPCSKARDGWPKKLVACRPDATPLAARFPGGLRASLPTPAAAPPKAPRQRRCRGRAPTRAALKFPATRSISENKLPTVSPTATNAARERSQPRTAPARNLQALTTRLR